MPDLSPFQTLPIHIAEAIGYYCIGLQRHRHKDRFSGGNKARHVWLVLHDVSRSWMQLARRNLNKSVTLRLSANVNNDKFATTLLSRRVIGQSTAVIRHVKEVNVYVYEIVEEPNEADLEKLSRVWPEDLVFPKALLLTCYLGSRYSKASNIARNDRYFKWLVERVRSSAPNLQKIAIRFGESGMICVSPGVLFSKEWNASLFLSALFRTAIWGIGEVFNLSYMDNEHILIQNATELITSFRHHTGFKHEFASWIIRKSAATLEKLYYGEYGGGGFKDFMFDSEGQAIVYPRLRDLYVRDSSDDKGEFTTDKSIVPFPVLQRLSVYSGCVFKDDTLFRGPNNALVSLDIGLHRGFVDIFRKYKVFSQGAYPSILHINATLDDRHSLTISADEFAEAAFGLVLPTTQSVTINGGIPFHRIVSIIPTCPHLENIQILHLARAMLNLLEILDIFKYFPHVTDFGCCFRGSGPELAAIQDKLIPSHLGSQYSQPISRLRCWHMYYSGPVPYGDMAVLFVTLAVLCPNFTFVKEWENDREEYESKIGYILSSGLYDQHAERLEHLFES